MEVLARSNFSLVQLASKVLLVFEYQLILKPLKKIVGLNFFKSAQNSTSGILPNVFGYAA